MYAFDFFYLNFHNDIVNMHIKEYVQQKKHVQYAQKIFSKLIIIQVYRIVGYAKQINRESTF